MKAMTNGEGSHAVNKLMPNHPTDTKEITKDLLSKKIVNNCCDTPTLGTIRENFNIIGRHIQESMSHMRIPIGNYTSTFSVVVTEGGVPKATKAVNTLAEAIADAEEILQFHPSYSVTMNINFKNGRRNITETISMPKIIDRQPLNENHKLLFRFNVSAQKYASQFMPEATMVRHSWGTALVLEGVHKSSHGSKWSGVDGKITAEIESTENGIWDSYNDIELPELRPYFDKYGNHAELIVGFVSSGSYSAGSPSWSRGAGEPPDSSEDREFGSVKLCFDRGCVTLPDDIARAVYRKYESYVDDADLDIPDEY